MKIVSWNVNSIKQRLGHLIKLIKEESPDIILLQETKSQDHQFPEESFADLGYNIIKKGQKTFNGVAILSKIRADESIISLPSYDIDNEDGQARFIEAVFNFDNKIYRIISVYVPNGSEVGSEKFSYKLKFIHRLYTHLEIIKKYDENIIIAGDFNICYADIDLYAPDKFANDICYSSKEKKALRSLLALDFFDSFRILHPEKQQFSWWDYRGGSYNNNKGIRIDYILGNSRAINHLHKAKILEEFRRLEKPSDHAPCLAEFL